MSDGKRYCQMYGEMELDKEVRPGVMKFRPEIPRYVSAADYDALQAELTRLRGLIQSLGTDARCTYRVTGSEDEWDVVRYVGEYGYGAVATFSSKESADAYAALLREAQR